MIVHIESQTPRLLENKVKDLISRKLYIKVNEEKIFIDKEDFIGLILQDVIALATSDYDVDEALALALKDQARYRSQPDAKRLELEEASVEFQVEIDAYRVYLDGSDDEMHEDEIFTEVLFILNSEVDLLERKMHKLIIQALAANFSEEDASALGADRSQFLDSFANQVRLISLHDNLEDAVEEGYSEFENHPQKHLVKKESLKKEYIRFAPLASSEIAAYKIAMSMHNQNAEFSAILAMVKQLLQLKD